MTPMTGAVMWDILKDMLSSKHLGVPNREYDNDMNLVLAIQEGLPALSVQRAAKILGLPTSIIDSIVSRRTLERRLKGNLPLSPEESDRLVRVVRIMARAIETFGDRDVAIQWMNAPNRAMGGHAPLSVINTDPGVEIVQRILGRIEHGVYS
jgi:putative toxin-antitoxin system antitoxin component (TIGR02293 family)